ncbi:MAG: Na+:solute symporter [Bacteroidetes bacterium]|nr:Na+:solute symporter [Bacteroidota bacterium]MBU1116280.1 Na+:solute symporter [Bacteroidota bacterium]MBU1797128.1 Na+:solute symporter [Bacteroidota bacterium]
MGQLQFLDIAVIVGFFLVIFGIAAYYSKKGSKNTDEFFLSGRNLPWYIAGTAMVATTFAADTPLAVTELVAKNGIAGNWMWWNLIIGGVLTVFFFARLWRRAEIVTDVEFAEFRYSGKAAAALRGFRALYLGLLMNAIVMGWVNKAMEKIFRTVFPGFDAFLLVVILVIIITIYASASGLVGTSRTDSFQFVFAMVGCIVLAIIVVQLPEVGGMVGMQAKLSPYVIDFLPRIGEVEVGSVTSGVLALSIGAFIAHMGIQWWASWYPGADPGGGGYIAQRMMSAKNEKHSLFATLWFTVAHFALRPWPWILVALAALVILPREQNPEILMKENPALYQQVVQVHQTQSITETVRSQEFLDFYDRYENTVDPGIMYPKLMLKYLPAGLLGMLIAVFLAAYMSTIASQLNWGTSYIINDFYRRFLVKTGTDKHYVLASRISMFIVVIFALVVTKYFLTTISGAWEFILAASAGTGTVLILRWFWWRINAWSEIAAMVTPFVILPIVTYGYDMTFPFTLYPIVAGTSIVWLAVTFLTKPTDEKTLFAFYRKVHPGGIGWKMISDKLPDVKSDSGFGLMFLNWFLGVILIYTSLFGIGKLLFGDYLLAATFILLAIFSGAIIYRNLGKQGL